MVGAVANEHWIRQGGWVIPLDCTSAQLQSWLSLLHTVQHGICSLWGGCSEEFMVDPEDCQSAWTPLTIAGTAIVITGTLLVLMVVGLYHLLRWMRMRHSSTMVAAATAAVKELQHAQPHEHPPAPHVWTRLHEHELSAPLLCSVCSNMVEPENMFQRVQICEVCGELVHESCARHAGEDCKPVAVAAKHMAHLWKPAGTVFNASEDPAAAAEGPVQTCLYCEEPCETDLFSLEPMWSCVWCDAVTHVRCHQRLHPHAAPGAGTQEEAGGGPGASEQAGRQPQKAAGPQSGPAIAGMHVTADATQAAVTGRSDALQQLNHGQEGTAGTGNRLQRPHRVRPALVNGDLEQQPGMLRAQSEALADDMPLEPSAPQRRSVDAAALRQRRRAATADQTVSELRAGSPFSRRTGSFGALMNALTSVVGGDPTAGDFEGSRRRQRRPHRDPSALDVERLDRCGLGLHRRLVLPPTCVQYAPSPARESDAWRSMREAADAAKSLFRRNSVRGIDRADVQAPASEASLSSVGSSDMARQEPRVEKAAATGPHRRATWLGGMGTQWEDYRIESVPRGWRPLLVFINTKSGPQLGHALRRQFLRLLNPLQVVELPRQKPDEALKLFSGVPARILVVGGDGTVAWVLSSIDALQASMPPDWTPPPVGVLPLGTGNDLARVLNWGGGIVAFKQRGLAAVLRDLEQSAVALLDRWDLRITPEASRRDNRSSFSSGTKKLLEPKKALPVTKCMNNYLGIGVDAKSALDFHHIRERYPHWFCGQFLNKLWYTTLGATEIAMHSSAGLSKRLQVECDGQPLDLPDDIEGILFVNIASYMGGVDLWASGQPTAGSQTQGKQSMCDGMLEVVGVYGSWHLGQLQVGLSGARRLAQCASARITVRDNLPMQCDGEPWKQSPATLEISLKSKALMLRRMGGPLAKLVAAVADIIENCEVKGIISAAQRQHITRELAAQLQPFK